MTFRSSHPAVKVPANSNEDQGFTARSVRGQQSVWGLPPPRRGLTPLSTAPNQTFESGQAKNPPASSPFGASFSPIISPSIHDETARSGHTSRPSRTSFPALQPGSTSAPTQALLSPRSRAITPSASSHSTSTATSIVASQFGGGGGSSGGGASRNPTLSPPLISPTSNTFERVSFNASNTPSAASSQSSVSKITTTQIFLLLNSITEKEGKAKWEAQAENIRKVRGQFCIPS